MKRFMIVLASAISIVMAIGLASAEAKVIGKAVEYTVQGVTMKGYLAYDDNIKGKRPGVLVVQEWWGVNDYIRRRARMLAELGYTALAVDMYGEGKQATNPKDAGDMATEVMKNFDTTGKARFEAGEELLKKQPTVDPERIGAIGYCFGGGVVLNIATGGTDLKGIVSFHGSLGAVKPAGPGVIKAKLLVLQGGDDKFVTPDTVAAFKKEMDTAGADYKFIVYPGATHAFTNPDATANGKKFNIPIAYNKKADKESWREMKTFLAAVLKK
ncbi:MAG: dienelactone hydrolase family protein [Betaproteobacteria bacterium]